MPDLQKYWQEIRTLVNTLPAFVWLVSLEDPKRGMRGGSLAEATAETAAKLLQAKSHRRATDEEIEAHRSQQIETQRAAFQERLRGKGIAVVTVPRPTGEISGSRS